MKIEHMTGSTQGEGYPFALFVQCAQESWGRPLPDKLPPCVRRGRSAVSRCAEINTRRS